MTSPGATRDRRALVTGAGNPRGIGHAICARLRDAGWSVHGVDRDDAELGDPAAAPFLLDAAQEALGGPVSCLVNNAAHSTTHSWDETDAPTLDAHYAVNVRAPVLLSVELARRLPQGVPGRIVNLVSGQDLGPMPGELAYATTKGALATFTRQFAAEVANRGITVNAVQPGPVDTGWMTPDVRDRLRAKFPTGRLGEPDDAARVVAWLCSVEAAWVTGQVVNAEGGFLRV